MRTTIVYTGADELTYEIRGIVTIAKKIEKLGQPITWENIGDPVQKGEQVPVWIKEIIKKRLDENAVFGYSPTKGLEATRTFLAEYRKKESGKVIDAEDIIFFNGLGDAISKVYTYLNENARIIGPSPAYSTHSSAEAGHAGAHHLTYRLLPDRNWLPDINDLRNKVHYNPQIAGILIINPDNPTGMVYPRRVLEEIVAIAREYDLFIISDEIYAHLAYGETPMTPLAEIIGDVPGIAMRGISKEMPWPGSRCGWIEIYNRTRDPQFERYVQTILDAKMLEVCSTTLPQAVIPEVMGDARYKTHLEERAKMYARRADRAYAILRDTKGILAPKPGGAFYMTIIFNEDALPPNGKLDIQNAEIKKYIETITQNIPADKRFAYYLLGKTGICVVPLSGFNSHLMGFRVTLLESDEKKFEWIFTTLKTEIENYLKSGT
jgi:aspartate/methionine/tyrosine aminotransferase